MKTPYYLLVMCSVILLLSVFIYGRTAINIAYAEEQISVFYRTLHMCQKGDAEQLEAHRLYIQSYYPSGTKQNSGTRLDNVVEMVRSEVLEQIDALE